MSKRTTVRIPDDLYRWLAERAKRERRTVSNLLIALLAESRDHDPVVTPLVTPGPDAPPIGQGTPQQDAEEP